MVHGADALLERLGDGEETRSRIGATRLHSAGSELIRRLAADHLRELRDDGVTLGYIARMYGVTPERMETLFNELVPSPPR